MTRKLSGVRAVLACGLVLGVAASQTSRAAPGEFTLDQHTLLLAHFNDSVRRADYAMGWREFGGSGAHLTDGYFGKAIDLRGVQFDPDFLASSDSRVPRLTGFGVWPHGNIDFTQGTFEFWFKVSPDGLKQNRLKQSLFFTHYTQPLKLSISGIYLTRHSIDWKWHTLASQVLEGRAPFQPALDPADWHHYAMCWSQGEFVIYVDGRPVGAHDMTGNFGLALVAAPNQFLAMNGIAMDELRISSVVRYPSDFEPAWRDGQRPAFAFAGIPGVKRCPAKLEAVSPSAVDAAPAGRDQVLARLSGMLLTFDRASGALIGLDAAGVHSQPGRHGVLLWEGLKRLPLIAASASGWRPGNGSLSFDQRFGDRVALHHDLAEHGAAITWRVSFRNLTNQELWLEAMLSVPVPMAQVREYFDMSSVQDQLPLPRRRDSYFFSLPFAAAAGGGHFVGLGIDPHADVSALIAEWLPDAGAGTIRQGTRVVLDPQGEYALPFCVLSGAAETGALDAVAGYHAVFPDLYRRDPSVPIYSYLPIARYFEEYPRPDMARQCYMGSQWGHGPSLGKGDEWGTQRYWDMAKKDSDRKDYAYARKLQGIYGTLDKLHQRIVSTSKNAYDRWYTIRRSHYLPNWAMQFIVEDLWPEGMVGGDPLVVGQYYSPSMYYANEFRTPLGEHYKKLTLDIMQHIAQYSPGFINDMCHTSPMRFTDTIAQKTPGRAFSRDRGAYLVGAFGNADRYRLINAFRDPRGFRQSIWSDGGVVSYQLSALSTADAIETYIIPEDTTGPEQSWQAARYLLGEKPLTMHCDKESDYTGSCLRPEDFTPATLRDYYRYVNAQIQLCALRYGIHLPYDLIEGQQELMENNPMVVESIVLGRKVVPGARVAEPLFVRRSGEGLQSFLAVGNDSSRPITTKVVATKRYFGGRPVFGAYFGGALRHLVDADSTCLPEITVGPRSIIGFKTLGMLQQGGPCSVTSTFVGDGIRMQATFDVDASARATLMLNTFASEYRVTAVAQNGKPVAYSEGNAIPLPVGKSSVAVNYVSAVLAFTPEEWQAVDLLKEGKANFCLVTRTTSPFDSGTAGWLNDFLDQYDQEDGVMGNLPNVPVSDSAPAGFQNWKVIVSSNAALQLGQVRVAPAAREVRVEGPTPGEARRAMAVFMRLVDRKYPHIGRYFNLKRFGNQPWTRLQNKDTTAFFAGFSDKEFLTRPILRPDLEALYAGGNVNFAAKYRLRFAPYIFEPTYTDKYVYGYRDE